MRILALLVGATLGTAVTAGAQFALPAPLASGEDFSVELGAMLWQPSPELRLQTGPEAVEDAPVPDDLAEVFGLERRRFTEYRLALKPGRRHRFRFSHVPMHYQQDAAVALRSVSLGAASFAEGDTVAVGLRWEQWRIGYQYDLASTERGLIGFILEVRRNRIVADLASDTEAQAIDERITVPAVGFIARGYLHRYVSLTFEMSGFGVPGLIGRLVTDDEVDVTSRDLDFHLTGNLSRHVGLQAGYRRVRTDYLKEAHRGELALRGWYAGALVRF